VERLVTPVQREGCAFHAGRPSGVKFQPHKAEARQIGCADMIPRT